MVCSTNVLCPQTCFRDNRKDTKVVCTVSHYVDIRHLCFSHRHLLWLLLIQELSYRKQIARQLRTQFVEGITVTLKSTLRVTQDHWKRNHWTDYTRLTIRRVIGRWILSWPWNVGQRSLKVIESGTIWKFGYGFLTCPTLTLTITLTHTLTLGLVVKVIENGAVR